MKLTKGHQIFFIIVFVAAVINLCVAVVVNAEKETQQLTQLDSAMAENARLKRALSLWPEEPSPNAETLHVFKPDTIFLKPARKW